MTDYNLNINLRINKQGNGLEVFNNQTQTAATKASLLGNTVGGLLTNAIQSASRAIIAFAEDSNRAFSEVDSLARQVFTLIPGMSDQMKQELIADALEIGTELGRLPDEVLPALYQALSLGIPKDNIFAAIEIASEAARAGDAELAVTMVTGQSIVNAYGASVYELSEVYDVLFTVVKNGAVTFDDLNSGMSAITSVAGEAHVGLEDIGAAIITMTKQGDSFAEVSSILSNVLAQLAIEGSTAGAAFKEMAGTSFTDFMDEGHSFTDALTLMDEAAKKAGVSILQMVGGDSSFMRDIEAARGLAELTGRHLEKMAWAADLTNNSLGNTAEAAAEVAGSMEIVEAQTAAATEAMKFMLGEALSPMKRAWLEAKTAAAEYWATVFEGWTTNQTAKETIEDLGVALEQDGISKRGVAQHTRELSRVTEYWSQSSTDAAEAQTILFEADQLLRHGFTGTTNALYQQALANIELAEKIEQAEIRQHAQTAAMTLTNEKAVAFGNSLITTAFGVETLKNELINVTEVLDGDTLKFETIDGEIETLRFRNINTAEIDHGEGAMPFGAEALKFTQVWVDNHPITIGAELDRESYGRIIAAVPDLEEALIRAGLAIPMPVTLSDDPETAAYFQEVVMEAAAAGIGMFEDQALAARILSGELVDLGAYYEEVTANQQALKTAYNQTAAPINELIAAQQELANAQGAGAEEAAERVITAQEDIQGAYRNTALAAFEAANAGNAGAFEAFISLQVELGNITQETADARIEMANMNIEATALGSSAEFAALTTGQQANAINLLAEGYAATAEAATNMAAAYDDTATPAMIAAAEEAENLFDPLNRIGTGEFNTVVGVDTETGLANIIEMDNAIGALHNKTVTITVKQVGRVTGSVHEKLVEEGGVNYHATGTGGWLTVPPGYENDTYFAAMTSGERYAVVPEGDGLPSGNENTSATQMGDVSISVIVQAPSEAAEDYGTAAKDGVLRAAEQLGMHFFT